MVSKSVILLLGLALFVASSPGQARLMSTGLGRSGRNLLDIRVQASGDVSTWNPSVIALDTHNSSSQCAFQGGSVTGRAPVQGPLYVVVPQGKTAIVSFEINNQETLNLQNLPSGVVASEDNHSQYGLSAVKFTADQTVGTSATVTAELHLHSGDYQKDLCQMTVTFVVADAPIPPSPPPPATPTPVNPKAPCYCSPAANGQSACFDFNQASSDINCLPPSAYKCQTSTAAAGQYSIQQGGPIYLCNV